LNDGGHRIVHDDWISKCVNDALVAAPGVAQAAVTTVEKGLRGQLGDRQLRPGELAEMAKQLLADLTKSGASP